MTTAPPGLLGALLDSLLEPFLFADRQHVIRYMNRSALAHYRQGEALLGTSLLDCHSEADGATIQDILARMEGGLEEELITDNDKWRIFMRAVRDENGDLLGYYERYEPPRCPTCGQPAVLTPDS